MNLTYFKENLHDLNKDIKTNDRATGPFCVGLFHPGEGDSWRILGVIIMTLTYRWPMSCIADAHIDLYWLQYMSL